MDENFIEYKLNRLNIVGEINSNTPICVIIEIAISLSIDIDKTKIKDYIYFKRLIQTINTSKTLTLNIYNNKNHKYTPEEYQKIAGFVNGNLNVKWKVKNLIESLHHMLEYYNKDIPKLPEEFEIGQKTNENIYTYNACMLYRICIYYNINLNSDTTIYELGYCVKNCSKNVNELKEILISSINSMSKTNLINILMSNDLKITGSPNIKQISSSKKPLIIKNSIKEPILTNINYKLITSVDLKIIYNNFMDYNYYLNLLEPTTHEESIVLAALIYGINLTECSNPHTEFNILKNNSLNGTIQNTYIPMHDEIFKQKYLNNPKWFDIRYIWEPKLKDIYTEDNLINFIKSEGYKTLDNHIKYDDLLYQIRCIPTFYLGKYPNCILKKTPIYYENIEDIDNDLLISYGILESQTFMIFTVNELTDYFLNSKTFTNPCNPKETFSDVSIEKLKNFCFQFLNGKKKYLTNICINYKKFNDALDEIKKFNETILEQCKIFRNVYLFENEKIKKIIDNLLINLLEIGYYMRGWKINNLDLPLNKYKTIYDLDKQVTVELNTTNSIIEFEKTLDLLKSSTIYDLFINLPILCVNISDNTYIFKTSSNPEMGISIIDRINIAKNGTSEYSCIRMTSNWLVASAYYYIKLTDKKEPFNILELSDIS